MVLDRVVNRSSLALSRKMKSHSVHRVVCVCVSQNLYIHLQISFNTKLSCPEKSPVNLSNLAKFGTPVQKHQRLIIR